MNLNINFMIKDGQRIISRDTKGYKVVLNRIEKKFNAMSNSDNLKWNIDVIIQMSKEGSYNKRGKNYTQRGTCKYLSNKYIIIVWFDNCSKDMKEVLETLAHEFGHAYDRLNNYKAFIKKTTRNKEQFADSFSKKMVKRELIYKSISGQVRSIAASKRNR